MVAGLVVACICNILPNHFWNWNLITWWCVSGIGINSTAIYWGVHIVQKLFICACLLHSSPKFGDAKQKSTRQKGLHCFIIYALLLSVAGKSLVSGVIVVLLFHLIFCFCAGADNMFLLHMFNENEQQIFHHPPLELHNPIKSSSC